MKKSYISIFAMLILGGSLQAQITLTSGSHAPKIGENYSGHTYDAEAVTPGPGGANVTWDFSGISSQGTFSTEYVNPSTLSDASNHTGANLATSGGQGESYFYVDNSSYEMVGMYTQSATRLSFTDFRTTMKYPITYGDVHAGTLDGTMEIFAANMTYDRAGTTHIEADGYGTLIMPYGTINNVLRVIVVHEYSDDMSGTSIDYVDSTYMWYNDEGIILTYVSFEGSGMTDYSGTYTDEALVSSPEIVEKNAAIRIFPNPAQDNLNILLLDNHRNAKVQITDLTGKIIEVKSLPAGAERFTTDVSNLAKGIYIVQVIEDKTVVATQKLVVN